MSFETVVQKAVYSQLTNNVPLMAAVVGVYGDVIQPGNSGNKNNFPYVVIGDDNHAVIDTDTELGNQVNIAVHVWSRDSGRKETKLIQGLVKDSLHRADLVEPGYKFVTITQTDSQTFLDADGVTRHGVQNFKLLIDKV